MKYVPVLRYRQEEKAALFSTKISSKIMPLIEIVKEIPNKRSQGDFESVHVKELSVLASPFIIDFPMYLPLTRSTITDVSKFLRPIQISQNSRIKHFLQLIKLKNMIPTVSYNPRIPYAKGHIINEERQLRNNFKRLAFRIFTQGFFGALSDVASILNPNDIIIFDIDDAPHGNPGLFSMYQNINNIGINSKCATVLIRAAIDQSLTNKGLIDNQIIIDADNSLLTEHRRYGFTAFGDYSGIKKDLLQVGGTISPGFIYYSWTNNCYIGYSGRIRILSEFESHIAPSVLNSIYWGQYPSSHHVKCPGCQTILNIIKGITSGKSQAKWKRISMMHYLHTMEEFL